MLGAGFPIVAICLLHQRLVDRSIFLHSAVVALIGFIVGLRSILRQQLGALSWWQGQFASLVQRAATLRSHRAVLTAFSCKEHVDASRLLACAGDLPRLALLSLRTAHRLLLP